MHGAGCERGARNGVSAFWFRTCLPGCRRNRFLGAELDRQGNVPRRAVMPFLPIILWVGVPVVLLGGGYMLVHMVH